MARARLRAGASKDGVGGRSQGRSRVDEVSRETLEHACLAPTDPEVAELHLRLGPAERCRRSKAVGIAMLVDEVE